MKKQPIVLLGVGPCGLAAAWELQQRGVPFILFEASDHAGGLASSFVDGKGFTWDIGGHVFASTDATVNHIFSLFTKKKFNTYIRNASIFLNNTFISYPFQYALSQLPKDIQTACLLGLKEKTVHQRSNSFYDWILENFGSGMANYFFLPYNKKLWQYPITKMGRQWVNERIATTHDAHKGTAWGRNARFSVPLVGGIGSVFTAMASRLSEHIVYNKRAVRVDGKKQLVYFSDGSVEQYDVLFSTIPITELATMITGISIPSTKGLIATGVAAVGIGMQGKVPDSLRGKHWIYIPDPRIPFFRVSVYSQYAKLNAPPGTWSLLFEVAYDPKKGVNREKIIEHVVQSAVTHHFIPSQSDILDRFYVEAPFAYPVPTKGRDAILSRVIPALEKHHIFSYGRFGSWKYEEGNIDHVMRAGRMWAKQISTR